jgi:hypothetical protein
MISVLRAGGTPHLLTYATSAVRLSQAAIGAGLDLRGARIWVGGEPLTPARAASIRQSGAQPFTRYATMESGRDRGELSLPGDLGRRPRIRRPPRGDPARRGGARPGRSRGRPVRLVDPAHGPADPDQCLDRGPRGALEARLRLSAGAARVDDSPAYHPQLREAHGGRYDLPGRPRGPGSGGDATRRFGGGPTDYQLLEDETASGHPRLRLLVHPRLPGIDPAVVARVFSNPSVPAPRRSA